MGKGPNCEHAQCPVIVIPSLSQEKAVHGSQNLRTDYRFLAKKIRDKYGTELVEIWKKIGDSTSRDFGLSLINYTACTICLQVRT